MDKTFAPDFEPTFVPTVAAARSLTACFSEWLSRERFLTCSAMRGFFASNASCRMRKSQYRVVNGQALSPLRSAGS